MKDVPILPSITTLTPGNSAASFLACSGVRRSIWFVSFANSSARAIQAERHERHNQGGSEDRRVSDGLYGKPQKGPQLFPSRLQCFRCRRAIGELPYRLISFEFSSLIDSLPGHFGVAGACTPVTWRM
jgi:hypothetical protein